MIKITTESLTDFSLYKTMIHMRTYRHKAWMLIIGSSVLLLLIAGILIRLQDETPPATVSPHPTHPITDHISPSTNVPAIQQQTSGTNNISTTKITPADATSERHIATANSSSTEADTADSNHDVRESNRLTDTSRNPKNKLFSDAREQEISYPSAPEILRTRKAKINRDALNIQTAAPDLAPLEINLFPDKNFSITINRIIAGIDGTLSFYGNIDGEPLNSFVMTRTQDGIYLGDLTDIRNGLQYKIGYSAKVDSQTVTEYDPSKMPPRIHLVVPAPKE